MKNLLPIIGRYVNLTCIEYTRKTRHITFYKWYNKEKERWKTNGRLYVCVSSCFQCTNIILFQRGLGRFVLLLVK